MVMNGYELFSDHLDVSVFSAQISFFDDVGAMTLQYLDSLFQQDNLQKSQFFKGLAKILQKMPAVSDNTVICDFQ